MRRLAILLAFLAAVAFAAFAGGEQEGAATGATGIEVSDPGVYPIVQQPLTLSLLVPQNLSGTPDWSTNAASQWMEEVTGVTINYVVAPDFAQARTLAVASGDLQDMQMGGHPATDIMKYGPQGIYVALNDLIDEHAVWVQRMFEIEPWIREASTTPDGNMYGLPGVNDDLHGVYGPKMWLNRVWLERLGLEMPTTTDELFDVFMAFKNEDPNGNGKADEIPYSGAVTGWRAQIPGSINNAFLYVNINTNALYLDDGYVKYAFVQPDYRESLRFHRRLYENGLIDPAAFTQEQSQLRQLGENPGIEILGAAESGWWQGLTINGGESGRYKMYDLVPPLKGPDGYKTTGYYKYKANRDQFVITSACEYPEVAIKWADYIASPEGGYNTQYGPEGVGWVRPPEGSVAINGEPAKFERLAAQELKNFNWGFIGPRYQPIDERLGELRAEDYWDPAKLMTRLAGETLDKYVGVEPPDDIILPPIYLTEEQSSEIGLVESGIVTLAKESTVRFIIGELDIDRDWDRYVRSLEDAGLDRWIELYQEAYDTQYN